MGEGPLQAASESQIPAVTTCGGRPRTGRPGHPRGRLAGPVVRRRDDPHHVSAPRRPPLWTTAKSACCPKISARFVHQSSGRRSGVELRPPRRSCRSRCAGLPESQHRGGFRLPAAGSRDLELVSVRPSRLQSSPCADSHTRGRTYWPNRQIDTEPDRVYRGWGPTMPRPLFRRPGPSFVRRDGEPSRRLPTAGRPARIGIGRPASPQGRQRRRPAFGSAVSCHARLLAEHPPRGFRRLC